MSSIEKAMQRQKAAAKADKVSTVQAAVESEQDVKEQAKKATDVQQSNADSVASTPENIAKNATDSTSEKHSPAAKVKKSLGAGITEQDTETLVSSGLSDEDANDKLGTTKELDIDLQRLEEKGFVTLLEKRALINEEYRSIKRKLLNNAFGPISKTLKHSNLILVSSSKPNEGKTFTAVNLALSIALEQDKTVLLVDSDVLKPSVSKTLDIGANVGLIEYLLGEEKDVRNIMYKTNIRNLRVIPAGLPHHLSNELLSSDKMMKLIEEFATRYPDRIVVFDAPPLLGVNETSVMAEQCGQGVVVVEEHKSKIADVQKAVSLLPDEMAVGFVLNKVTSSIENQGYGYYYGSSDKDETPAKSA